VFDIPLKPSILVTGSFDLEAVVARYPRHYVVKGMFCNRFVDLLGDDFAALLPQLISPPRGGRYLVFNDYPAADYTRIAVASAAKLYPGVDLCEATRRVAREDFGTFASSTWGKIALTLVGDPHTALMHMPDAFARVAPGPELRAEERDANTVRMSLRRYRGLIEYMLGQFEGVVLAFGRTPTITVRRVGAEDFSFDVDHG
jgi:uncharacterized protein (TIGR02265 family)